MTVILWTRHCSDWLDFECRDRLALDSHARQERNPFASLAIEDQPLSAHKLAQRKLDPCKTIPLPDMGQGAGLPLVLEVERSFARPFRAEKDLESVTCGRIARKRNFESPFGKPVVFLSGEFLRPWRKECLTPPKRLTQP